LCNRKKSKIGYNHILDFGTNPYYYSQLDILKDLLGSGSSILVVLPGNRD